MAQQQHHPDPTLEQTHAYLRFAVARAIYGADRAERLAAAVGDTDEGSPAWVEAVQLAADAWLDTARMAREVREVRAQLDRQLALVTGI